MARFSTPFNCLNAQTCVELNSPAHEFIFPARSYDLEATLTSGQVFGWQRSSAGWIGVVNGRWVSLCQQAERIIARTAEPHREGEWLADFLQVQVELDAILRTFPGDQPMRDAVESCRGLRLLRQDPWECLASFILSSTKQIVQIQQIVALLRARFGSAVTVPRGEEPAHAFPTVARLALATEAELRACKMGFRAPYLLATARRIAEGECDLEALRQMPVADARAELVKLPGVGHKIADCVLLFAYGFPTAFPIDVWVAKSLRSQYPRARRVSLPRLRDFALAHFGPNAGFAQQYLFHHIRTQSERVTSDK